MKTPTLPTPIKVSAVCPVCFGDGWLNQKGVLSRSRKPCKTCKGTGWILATWWKCK